MRGYNNAGPQHYGTSPQQMHHAYNAHNQPHGGGGGGGRGYNKNYQNHHNQNHHNNHAPHQGPPPGHQVSTGPPGRDGSDEAK